METMPMWLQILNIAVVLVIAPSCGYLLSKSIKNDKELAVLKNDYKESMKRIVAAFKQITTRCRDRACWIQGLVATVQRVDKNVAVLAERLGAKIDVSNPGDTMNGILHESSKVDSFAGIVDIDEELNL